MDVCPRSMHGSRRSNANVNNNQSAAANFGNQRWGMESTVVVSEVVAGCLLQTILRASLKTRARVTQPATQTILRARLKSRRPNDRTNDRTNADIARNRGLKVFHGGGERRCRVIHVPDSYQSDWLNQDCNNPSNEAEIPSNETEPDWNDIARNLQTDCVLGRVSA
jgi:hypothetical protein